MRAAQFKGTFLNIVCCAHAAAAFCSEKQMTCTLAAREQIDFLKNRNDLIVLLKRDAEDHMERWLTIDVFGRANVSQFLELDLESKYSSECIRRAHRQCSINPRWQARQLKTLWFIVR